MMMMMKSTFGSNGQLVLETLKVDECGEESRGLDIGVEDK
jgi:hypothetical protein